MSSTITAWRLDLYVMQMHGMLFLNEQRWSKCWCLLRLVARLLVVVGIGALALADLVFQIAGGGCGRGSAARSSRSAGTNRASAASDALCLAFLFVCVLLVMM
jgi:hypothetical protein